MKLLRYGPTEQERPGMLDQGGYIRDLTEIVPDIAGSHIDPTFLAELAARDPASFPVVDTNPRIGPCVGSVGKIVGIGLNYREMAGETGDSMSSDPLIFLKASSSISGPYDDTTLPPGSEKTDWEVELAVVIGRRAKNIAQPDAYDHIAGYCTINDLSERKFQLERGGQWVKGKSYDTFAPIGPWLVTKDEIADPHKLRMWLKLNGKITQEGSSDTMINRIDFLVAYISQFMTLHPGDIISTGTIPGLGMDMSPPRHLRNGDEVELGIDGLGWQRHRTVEDRPA